MYEYLPIRVNSVQTQWNFGSHPVYLVKLGSESDRLRFFFFYVAVYERYKLYFDIVQALVC